MKIECIQLDTKFDFYFSGYFCNLLWAIETTIFWETARYKYNNSQVGFDLFRYIRPKSDKFLGIWLDTKCVTFWSPTVKRFSNGQFNWLSCGHQFKNVFRKQANEYSNRSLILSCNHRSTIVFIRHSRGMKYLTTQFQLHWCCWRMLGNWFRLTKILRCWWLILRNQHLITLKIIKSPISLGCY